MPRNLFILFVLSLFFAGCSNKVPEGALPASELNNSSNAPMLQRSPIEIEIGDEIEVNVWRHNELQRKVLVDLAGNINLPLVGELYVEGSTLEELRETVAQAYRIYIVDPRVEVSPVNLTSKQFFVLGEVKEPGGFQMTREVALIDALSMAGGKTDDGNDNILLIRREGEVANVYVIPMASNDPRTYLYHVISSNDIIYVPTSTIADVELFMNRVNNIIAPILSIQRSVILWPDFIDAIRDTDSGSSPPIIIGN